MEKTISKQKRGRWEASTRGCCGNTVNRPSLSGRKVSALGLLQRVVFDLEQCRYVFPVGTKDIHLKIRFFFFFFVSSILKSKTYL